MGEGGDLAEEQHLALAQLEHEAGLQSPGQQQVADQGPVLAGHTRLVLALGGGTVIIISYVTQFGQILPITIMLRLDFA